MSKPVPVSYIQEGIYTMDITIGGAFKDGVSPLPRKSRPPAPWKTMKSAPRDGTAFVAWVVNHKDDTWRFSGEICIISFDVDAEARGQNPWRVNGVEDRLYGYPVLWQSCPSSPKDY